MKLRKRSVSVVLLALGAFAPACAITSHEAVVSQLGSPVASDVMDTLLEAPGPIEVETIVSADWQVDRSGLIDLDHVRAQEAGLQDGPEPIQIYFHAIRHPEHGLFIVDTGVETAMRDDPDEALISGLLGKAMNVEAMRVRTPLGEWLAANGPLSGVLMTHLHLDHVSGMRDVPDDVPVYTGPGEAAASAFLYTFVRGTVNEALDGKGPLREWDFRSASSEGLAGVVDVFGDRSLFAIWLPGHTPGSTAYLARTPKGPVLFVGDVCHTAWGWEHGVPPGTFTQDHEANETSLKKLIALVQAHSGIDVRLGHQSLGDTQIAGVHRDD